MLRHRLAAATVIFFVVYGMAPTAAADPSTTLTQPLFLEWDHMVLDVLIVPPAHGQIANGEGVLGGSDVNELVPVSNSYVSAAKKAIRDWQAAIRSFGSSALNRLVLNVYVAGRDLFPTSVLSELEVLMTFDETKYPLLGLTIAGPTSAELNGVEVSVGDNPRCTIANSMFGAKNFTFADMYNVAGHEFGHCLGVGHVQPTGNSSVVDDIMHAKYLEPVGGKGNKLHCMSNLNIAGLELAYDRKVDPKNATMLASDYRRIAC